jgi:hypothetical protein
VAAGLDGEWEQFGEGDAGEDEESAGGGAAAEAFAIEEERGEPGEDRFEGEDERGVGGGEIFLGPRLDGEGRCGGEDGGEEQGDHDAGGRVEKRWVHPGMFEEGQAQAHEDGAESDLEDGELFVGDTGGEGGREPGCERRIPGHSPG